MEIKHGLISADSHVVLHKDAYISRMAAKWSELAPQVVEIEGPTGPVERWSVYGHVHQGGMSRGVSNCPAVLSEDHSVYPQHWDEVPAIAYVPSERAKALDTDGVDGEVLFHNDPGSYYCHYGDAEFELACVQAYNDAVAEFRRESDRFIPLAMMPFLAGAEGAAAEVRRAVKNGHLGVMAWARIAQVPSIPAFTDPYWDPLWAECQELGVPVNLHHTGGFDMEEGLRPQPWPGVDKGAWHSWFTVPTSMAPPQAVPHLIFSGVAERFPRLRWIMAESGVGSLHYAIDACAHEWERRHLWTEGIMTHPWDIVRRQIFANFWYEEFGLTIRNRIGVDNLMWESDYPHVTSTYPHSWEFMRPRIAAVPEADLKKMLYQNVLNVYGISASVRLQPKVRVPVEVAR